MIERWVRRLAGAAPASRVGGWGRVLLLAASLAWCAGSPAAELAPEVERLGNPLRDHYAEGEAAYARNVWDMQSFAGRIFLGAGNSSNRGPAANAGRVPIVAFDPASGEFVEEGRVAEEQIDLFRVIDGRLYIPGHDATQNWRWGNYYLRRPDGDWRKYRNIPGALHVYDLLGFGGRLYTALGIKGAAAVGVSADGGHHWRIDELGGGRVYGLMPVGGRLFAVKWFEPSRRGHFGLAELEADGWFQPRYGYTIDRMFPETALEERSARAVRITPVGERTFYIGAYTHNDHQSQPFGLYLASIRNGSPDSRRLPLPSGTPRDLLVRDGRVYVLASEPSPAGYINLVYGADVDDPGRWRRVLTFQYPTFARSFERLGGAFYFGMGSEVEDERHWSMEELSARTGELLRVRVAPREGAER